MTPAEYDAAIRRLAAAVGWPETLVPPRFINVVSMHGYGSTPRYVTWSLCNEELDEAVHFGNTPVSQYKKGWRVNGTLFLGHRVCPVTDDRVESLVAALHVAGAS